MVFITEELIRKRSEHNELQISTLEEISLHQLDIEKIEYIDKWCRELKILYLQSNLIPKLENLSKLKKLEYLNLALNNITVIENLEGCESLTKLDLTINFIGKVTTVETLKKNSFLRDLYLTGNPCTDYIGYRDYVIAALPQLTSLDGNEISKSERIIAVQSYESLRCDMLQQETQYLKKQEKERRVNKEKEENEGNAGFQKDWYTDTENAHLQNTGDKKKDEKTEEEKDSEFWSKPTAYTPESRIETHKYMEEKRKEKESSKSNYPDMNVPKREIRYFAEDGRPLNINYAKIDFLFTEDDDNGTYVLDLACYKHMDTSLIDVDIQPTYVRVIMKGNVFQLAMNEEISPSAANAQRSQTTGHLVLTLPKLNTVLNNNLKNVSKKDAENIEKKISKDKSKIDKGIEKLEIKEKEKKVDIYNIVSDNNEESKANISSKVFTGRRKKNPVKTKVVDEDFIDDPDVPPLE